jgi:hypothetical protein
MNLFRTCSAPRTTVKVGLIGVVVAAACIAAPISASAGDETHACSLISPQRGGGISEMAACGKWGVRGDRVQFVEAINRPVEDRNFLSRLAH